MAEPFGIIAGALGIATVFTAAVDTFDYIQLGRHFGEDYQKAQLKLDIAALRLVRWGRAMNIYNDASLSSTTAATPAEAEKAKELLTEILDMFDKAKKVSSKYKLEKQHDQAALQVYGESDMGLLGRHKKMKDLVKRRQKGTSTMQKIQWALYRNRDFKRLVEDVTEFVGDLENIFPVAAVTRQIAAMDIVEVVDEGDSDGAPGSSLLALQSAADDVDAVLKESISAVMATKSYKNISIEESAKLVMGDFTADNALGKNYVSQPANVSYDGIVAKGNSRGIAGNVFGGKGIFDD